MVVLALLSLYFILYFGIFLINTSVKIRLDLEVDGGAGRVGLEWESIDLS